MIQRFSSGYKIFVNNMQRAQQGGISLACKDKHVPFKVEEVSECHPNVITLKLVTMKERWYVRVYLPPSDLATLAHV